MDPTDTARSAAAARQTEIYGESWATRLSRLMTGYRLSQAKLAAVIGLSAPMLSQLISGQRVKISNPAVYGRIVDLEEAMTDPAFGDRDPAQLAQLLERTAASQPVLSTRLTATPPSRETVRSLADEPDVRGEVVTYLASIGDPASLRAAAQAAVQRSPALAAVMHEAARRPVTPPDPGQ